MWTIPNLLTLARIVAIVPLAAMIEARLWAAALALFAAAAATDWLDGWLARRWKQQSDLGRMLDPIADKLIVAAVLVALGTAAESPPSNAHVLPFSEPHWRPYPWVTIAILSREILVAGLREFLGPKGIVVHVSVLAKWKTASQLVATALLLLSAVLLASPTAETIVGRAGQILLAISALLAWITAVAYLRVGLRHMEPSR